ncbi:AMMECR1 domain-containing protein [bacterium]|nr:MAG: AMMECR1 domain-containing protein [bacterium]
MMAMVLLDDTRLLEVARSAILAEVLGKPMATLRRDAPPQPVFITVEVGGKVRACRGSLSVRTGSLEEEVALAARGAAGFDPRYGRLTPAKVAEMRVTVTVIEAQKPIEDATRLRPEDGLALISGGKTGVVLPWEGKEAKVRLAWAYRKAGVAQGAPARLILLTARRSRS